MPSSPASRRALNRSWILVFKNNLTQESSCDYRQSIVPRARANVLRLFPSTGVLHQQMVPAPPAKIPAEIVLVGNRVSVIGVKSHGREIKSPVRNFLRNIDRKSTRLNSSHVAISYAVFCLKKKKKN